MDGGDDDDDGDDDSVDVMVSSPPNVMGGGIKFDPIYLGGRLDTFPTLGGTVHDGGRNCYDGGSLN